MSIGKRISYFRNKRGMTQKYMGIQLGFPESSADVRVAQYESGTRTPKDDLLKEIAQVLDVSVDALLAPDVNDHVTLMHTLFAFEDEYGVRIGIKDGAITLRFDPLRNAEWLRMVTRMEGWFQKQKELSDWEISKEEYDQWRYNYSEEDRPRGITAIQRQGGKYHYHYIDKEL